MDDFWEGHRVVPRAARRKATVKESSNRYRHANCVAVKGNTNKFYSRNDISGICAFPGRKK